MKTENKNRKAIKKLFSLAIALVMTVSALSALAVVCSAETGAPDVSSGATQDLNVGTQDPNGATDGGITFGDPPSGGQNGLPGQSNDGSGGFQAPPSGGNGGIPSFPELPNQSGGNGQSGNNADRDQQFPQFQPPTGGFGDSKGSADFNGGEGGFNYSEATFWLLVGVTGAALVSLCAVGIVKLAKRGKKAQPAAQPVPQSVSEPAQPAADPEKE